MTHPMASLHLFGLADRRLDVALTLGLLVLVIVSRLAAFPVSIWEQDEAVFAGAVLHFDPTDNLPHPPWFPLWIAAGKLVHLFGIRATTSLQLVSLLFSVWILFPLTALWSTVLPRTLAVGAAVIFLIAPGPWFFSGRAFCGTTATALLVAALAFWLGAEDRSRWLVAGSLVAALAVLVRPHFLPAVIGVMLIVTARAPEGRRRIAVAFAIPVLIGSITFVVLSGGPGSLWSALETHGQYHFSRLDQATPGFTESGFARALGHPAVAATWLGLVLVGFASVVHKKRWTSFSPIAVGALLPLVIVIHGLSNPTHARYAVSLLALSSGFVILGASTLFRRWTPIAVCVTLGLGAAWTIPQLTAYRTSTSPPIAAINEAILSAERIDGVVVADRKLHAFFVLRHLTSPPPVPIVFDHMIEFGHAPPPPPDRSVYIFDNANPNLMESMLREHRFTCSIPLVRTLSQDRFIELSVATGAQLRWMTVTNGYGSEIRAEGDAVQ